MNNEKQKLGVVLYHLKDKFAYGSTNGNEMSEFKFDEIQIATLFDYLRNGVFEGMFTFLEPEEFRAILELNYLNLAREVVSNEKIKELEKEFLEKEKELKVACKMSGKTISQEQPQDSQTQPE